MPTIPIKSVMYTLDGVLLKYVDGTRTIEPQSLKGLVMELPDNEWKAVVQAISQMGRWIEVQ